ncbi:uncharacterized protein LOC112569262 [Pomacea canaliculata]|uniref:uncharacterized protein LOC112569262 n=1 Tax=Pomacea canaliculata TaxID=400727 RepID=UPI000D734AFD|nr:uncharacterized protein LOC112569262 [Pomacea canaliculata]
MNSRSQLLKHQRMPETAYIVFMLLIYHAMCSHENCAVLEFHHLSTDVLSVFENNFAYVTFWINVSTCNETTDLSTITVYTRTNSGSLEYDGTVTYYKESCTVRPTRCLRCSTPSGPVELSRKVNRSHVQIEWEWELKDMRSGTFTTIRRELKLNVYYQPSVTSLTVDGEESSGNYVISEGHEVSISCSFEKGNPPTNFSLVDQTGKEIKASRGEQHLNLSLALRCKDDWPTIRCEGSGSEKNESVSFYCQMSSTVYR